MTRSREDFKILTYANHSSATDSEPKGFHHPVLVEPITLETESTWTHVGGPLDGAALPPSFHTWSQGTFRTGSIVSLLVPFLKFLHEFMKDSKMTHYCLSIRAQKSTHDFDIPRWHVDRRFFQEEAPLDVEASHRTTEGRNKPKPSSWKLATALV